MKAIMEVDIRGKISKVYIEFTAMNISNGKIVFIGLKSTFIDGYLKIGQDGTNSFSLNNIINFTMIES